MERAKYYCKQKYISQSPQLSEGRKKYICHLQKHLPDVRIRSLSFHLNVLSVSRILFTVH